MQACAGVALAAGGRPLAALHSSRVARSSPGRAGGPLSARRNTQIAGGRASLKVAAVAEAERTGGAAAAGAHSLSVEVKQEGAQTRILVEGTARPGERRRRRTGRPAGP